MGNYSATEWKSSITRLMTVPVIRSRRTTRKIRKRPLPEKATKTAARRKRKKKKTKKRKKKKRRNENPKKRTKSPENPAARTNTNRIKKKITLHRRTNPNRLFAFPDWHPRNEKR